MIGAVISPVDHFGRVNTFVQHAWMATLFMNYQANRLFAFPSLLFVSEHRFTIS